MKKYMCDDIPDRYELALLQLDRICREGADTAPEFKDYFEKTADFLRKTILLKQSLCPTGEAVGSIKEMPADPEDGASAEDCAGDLRCLCEKYELRQWLELNHSVYEQILPERYTESYGNPSYAVLMLGQEYGQLLSALFYEMFSVTGMDYEQQPERILIRLEVFLQVYSAFGVENRLWLKKQEDGEESRISCDGPVPPVGAVRRILAGYLNDYACEEAAAEIENFLIGYGEQTLTEKMIRFGDLSDERLLFLAGEYISDEELEIFRYLSGLPETEIGLMADTFTEGYRIGFVNTGKDLSKKKYVGLRPHTGFERMMRRALLNFDRMRLVGVVPRTEHTLAGQLRSIAGGMESSCPNRQFYYDHRNDIGLFLDRDLTENRLEALKNAYERLHDRTRLYAGPAVQETFGEALFSPASCGEAVRLSPAQEKMISAFRSRASKLYDDAVIGRERSFTIIAFPLPGISPVKERFDRIFHAVLKLNTLDYREYQRIQGCLIGALNEACELHIKGKMPNRTDLIVRLYPLKHPEKETIFENCVADVNIPVGEVFTTPVLKGTDGVLHVSQVCLEGLKFRDLVFTFKDGRTTGYSCGNFENEEENLDYIRDNILFRHESLPMGECAIGTNTTAYRAGRELEILDRFPILIAEKTGPHFALGDTCYSHEEDNRMFNPDGKEIVAKENDYSLLRFQDPEKAYFGCHTDITIPFEELESYDAVCSDGRVIPILRGGLFVLPGTEALNVPLLRLSEK